MIVLIIDDHPMFRVGLKVLLSELASNLTISDAVSVEEVTDDQLLEADIVLLDLNLGRMSGPDSFFHLKRRVVRGAVVIVSGNDDPEIIRDCIENGASGFIPKTSEPDVLVSALQMILSGGVYLPREAYLESGLQADSNDDSASDSALLLQKLTARQRKSLQLASIGLPNKTIAKQMGISEGTVKLHLTAAFRALEVKNRTEAVYKLSRLGIIL